MKYRRKGERAAVEYVFSPLGLVQRGPISYVLGSIADYDDVRTFALHRVQRATMLEDAVKPPKSFSLERSIESGVLHFGAGERIELNAIFDTTAAEHLQETPLTEDQKLTPVSKDRVRLQATVVDTPQLRWWLLAFGDGVEVKGPAALRAAFAKVASTMAAAYL
jgi:predicted DNA-binding transcriptional regulator YafY